MLVGNKDKDEDISNIPHNKRNNDDDHNSNDIDDNSAIQVCFPWLDSCSSIIPHWQGRHFLWSFPPDAQDRIKIFAQRIVQNCWQFHTGDFRLNFLFPFVYFCENCEFLLIVYSFSPAGQENCYSVLNYNVPKPPSKWNS